jgi:hypothetical protein
VSISIFEGAAPPIDDISKWKYRVVSADDTDCGAQISAGGKIGKHCSG